MSGDGVTQTNFTLPVTHNMVPKTKILAGFARTDGELVMDLLEIEIDCELEHKVHIVVYVLMVIIIGICHYSCICTFLLIYNTFSYYYWYMYMYLQHYDTVEPLFCGHHWDKPKCTYM